MNPIITLFIISLIILSCGKPQNSKTSGIITTSEDGSVQAFHSTPIINNDLMQTATVEKRFSETRRPYLLYYIVDSIHNEPFMKAAVDYELEQLRSICVEGANHVNWMIVRNSEVLKSKSYEVCRHGRHKTKNISHILDNLAKRYESKNTDKCQFRSEIDIWGSTTIVDDLFGLGSFIQEQQDFFYCGGTNMQSDWPHGQYSLAPLIEKSLNPDSNRSEKIDKIDLMEQYIKEYPLADAKFFRWALGENSQFFNPFHPRHYVPMLHIKSHGHFDYSITGLSRDQLKNKIKHQKRLLDQTIQNGNTPNSSKLKSLSLKTNVKNFDKALTEIIKEIRIMSVQELMLFENLKDLTFIGQTSDSTHSNSETLSEDCGLGGKEEGLTAQEGNTDSLGTINILADNQSSSQQHGLGSKGVFLGNQIGITPNMMASAFLSTQDDFRNIFAFIEACDTNLLGPRWNIWKDLQEIDVLAERMPAATYSAEGSLWYRNLDWHNLFQMLKITKNHQAHATLMQYLLIQISKKTTNFKPTDNKAYIQQYDAVLEEIKSHGVHTFDSYNIEGETSHD